MKALLVASVQSHIAQFHRPLIKILKEEGYTIDVAARDNLEEKNGLRIENVDHIYNVPFHRIPLKKQNGGAYRQLKAIIDGGNYDIICCNTPVASVLTRIAARKTRKKGTKVYYMVHGFHFFNGASLKNWAFYYPIEKISAHLADTIITITKEDYERASKEFKTNVVYVHGAGADQDKFLSVTPEENERFRRETGYDQRFVILCTGELNANKNQIILVDAMDIVVKKHPEALLLLAGNGPTYDDLRNKITRMNLDNHVYLLDYHPDIEKYANACDMVISISRREGLPMNIVEAMICRKPVLVSHNRGHDELVREGINGYFVDHDNPEKIAQKICEYIENPDMMKRMADAGREIAYLYQRDNVEKELRKIYFNK